MAEEYPESYDAVSAKYESSGFGSLNEKEQVIFTIWWLEAEVNNGGFNQYFWNSAGDHAGVALKSLRSIGATKNALLLERAAEIAFGGALPESRKVRQSLLEVNEEIKMEKLGELDFEFYEYPEHFYKLIDTYVA